MISDSSVSNSQWGDGNPHVHQSLLGPPGPAQALLKRYKPECEAVCLRNKVSKGSEDACAEGVQQVVSLGGGKNRGTHDIHGLSPTTFGSTHVIEDEH